MISLADVENAITPDTAVVSLMWANNETGVLFPVEQLAQLCRARGRCGGTECVPLIIALGKAGELARKNLADYERTFAGIESEALLLLLDQAGICASSGSACLADSPDPSHVIAAMKPGAAARQSIRFSLGAESTAAEIDHAIAAVQQSVATLAGTR